MSGEPSDEMKKNLSKAKYDFLVRRFGKDFETIKNECHVRGLIYRIAKPNIRYPKNHHLSLDEQVPDDEKKFNDWMEFDPADYEGTYPTLGRTEER